MCRRYVGCCILYAWCTCVMLAFTSSMCDPQALCGLLQPLCMMHRRYVGCYILYVWCIGAIWAVTASMYLCIDHMLDIASSMHDVRALCWLLHPFCVIHKRRVGCYIFYVWCTCVMWAFTASMCDAQVLCELLHPLTLSLTIIKVQRRARNPNPTTVDTAL